MKRGRLERIIREPLRRFYLNKNENILLADALNLLSPTSDVKNNGSYKPSLLANLTKGSASEQFKEKDIITYNMPKPANTERFLNNLFSGIKSSTLVDVTNHELLDMSGKELSTALKSITSETRLMEIGEMFYFQGRLTMKILTDIILNKHLKKLSSFPIDLNNLRANSHLTWNDLHYIQFQIILLKKYHDLKQPLLILKNLRMNFDNHYYPLIKSGKLAPFYERIVWKFYFEYIKQFDELYYIKQLTNIKSTFLIWEVSIANSYKISSYALNNISGLSTLQKSFFKICSTPIVRDLISSQLQDSYSSKVLSDLKRISIKHKIHSVTDSSASKAQRQNCYLLVDSLDSFITSILQNSKDPELSLILEEIQSYKQAYLKRINEKDEQTSWFDTNVFIPEKSPLGNGA